MRRARYEFRKVLKGKYVHRLGRSSDGAELPHAVRRI